MSKHSDAAIFEATVHSINRRDSETKITLIVPRSETAEVLKLVQWEDKVIHVTVNPIPTAL